MVKFKRAVDVCSLMCLALSLHVMVVFNSVSEVSSSRRRRSLDTKFLTLQDWVNPDNAFTVFSSLIVFVIAIITWLNSYWLGKMFITSTLQWIVSLYQVGRILLTLGCFCFLRFAEALSNIFTKASSTNESITTTELLKALDASTSYAEYQEIASMLDIATSKNTWKKSINPSTDRFDGTTLDANTRVMKVAMNNNDFGALRYELSTSMKRNKLGIDAAALHLECKDGTKRVIETYVDTICESLDFIASSSKDKNNDEDDTVAHLKKLKRSHGSTALLLSGGGSLGMIHMGVIKALLEANVLPNVVSGTSGGSIVAGVLATRTNDELKHIIVPDISTRFKSENIEWFPPLVSQIRNFWKNGYLVNCVDFERTTQRYFGEPLNASEKSYWFTFQDAFERTGRNVSIAVSASEVYSTGGGHHSRKVLLNHINTPHIFIWSGVAVSCSLPGIMRSKQLMARDSDGNVVPYLSLCQEFLDGSLEHDLPFDEMASCFNLSNYVVSQVNPHVVPFLSSHDVDLPTSGNVFRTLESLLTADIRHRISMLGILGLFPKLYGEKISQFFKQSFVGDITIVPMRYNFAEAIGLKAILNPTPDDMKRYIFQGQQATWPKLSYIRHMCRIEKCLDKCIAQLEPEGNLSAYSNWFSPEENSRRRSVLHSHNSFGMLLNRNNTTHASSTITAA